MYPEGFPLLNIEDNIVVARVNLCCAAIAVLVFAFVFDGWSWTGRALALVMAAGLVYLAREIDRVFRRFDRPPVGQPERRAGSADPYISPFY